MEIAPTTLCPLTGSLSGPGSVSGVFGHGIDIAAALPLARLFIIGLSTFS